MNIKAVKHQSDKNICKSSSYYNVYAASFIIYDTSCSIIALCEKLTKIYMLLFTKNK